MVEKSKKYGCLTVLDDGEEYRRTELYIECLEKSDELRKVLEPYFEMQNEVKTNYPEVFDKDRKIKLTNSGREACNKLRRLQWEYGFQLDEFKQLQIKLAKHYKCECKCGKTHYYNSKTLESNPRFCIYPIPIASRFTYSIKAQKATERKREKYSGIESVLLSDKADCVPSEDYCALYNKHREKQLTKNEEKLNLEIAALPRIKAKNYDVDYEGKQYESLLIEECINDHLESKPTFSFTQFHHKRWHTITVYKQYRCKCLLCGREQLITCDKFGIYPPTEYGYRAYYGYWSDVSCDCHPISSFQWIVTKLLMENGIRYQVEYSFDDLYGIAGKNQLRFDFAVFNDDGTIKALIECQGEQHYKPVEEFGIYKFQQQIKNDGLKRQYTASHNIPLIEISYKQKQIGIVEEILKNNGII
ncbi:MAG: hypothetical protein IKZ29_08365 [Clostridiales bacterium]|nr:hypothetical protein [Clostridiales bacterium]